VTNPRNEPLADFLLAFPSSDAGSIVDTDLSSQQGTDFVTAIEHALVGDPEGRPARIALADYLLGPISADPVQAFVDEVSAAVARAKARYPEPRVVPLPPMLEGKSVRSPLSPAESADAAESSEGAAG
jgi:hypothetical protein